MKKYKLADVLKTEDIYHVDYEGVEWANYDTPDGQIGCIEVGTLHKGKWTVTKDYDEVVIELV